MDGPRPDRGSLFGSRRDVVAAVVLVVVLVTALVVAVGLEFRPGNSVVVQAGGPVGSRAPALDGTPSAPAGRSATAAPPGGRRPTPAATPAAASGATNHLPVPDPRVTYDSAGHSVASQAASVAWTQQVSGTDTALLVEVAVGNTTDSGHSVTVTDNGTAMTPLVTVHANDRPDGYIEVFGLAGVQDGTNGITATVSGGRVTELTGGSVSFDGAAQTGTFGNPASGTGNGTAISVTIPTTTADGLVAAFAACGQTIEGTSAPAAQEFIANQDNGTGAGNSAGAISAATGDSVTVSWTAAASQFVYWGAIAVEVNPAA